jgi:hypothetical protein
MSTYLERLTAGMARIPYSLIALLARISVAAVFWKSGQTKVEGFALDLVEGQMVLGWPRLSDNAVALFRDEYRLPLLSPELGATLAAFGHARHPAPAAATDFPPSAAAGLDTLQVNLGYRCNQSCLHCHVNAGPNRTEMDGRHRGPGARRCCALRGIGTLDLTGGAPELNPHFRRLVRAARAGRA